MSENLNEMGQRLNGNYNYNFELFFLQVQTFFSFISLKLTFCSSSQHLPNILPSIIMENRFFSFRKNPETITKLLSGSIEKDGGIVHVLWVILWADRIFKSNGSVSNIHWHFLQKSQLKCQTKQKQVFSFFYKDNFKKDFVCFFKEINMALDAYR